MPVTSVRLNAQYEKPLEKLARKLDRSKSYLINQAVEEFIRRQSAEDIRWVETLEALDSVKTGALIAEPEVISWLESWGARKEKSRPRS